MAGAQTDNPFRPGFGQVPPVLGGRVGVLSVIERRLRSWRLAGMGGRISSSRPPAWVRQLC